MAGFRLIQVLSWSNNPMSNIAVLCYGKTMSCFSRCVVDCYFYSQENRPIDMASFQLCYDLNKHTFDQDSILGLHPASWVITAIGPLVWVNICGVVTSP
jgi:hypothetical protein